jgi:hypothetical protein
MYYLSLFLIFAILKNSSQKLIRLQLTKLPSESKELTFLSDQLENSKTEDLNLLGSENIQTDDRVQTLTNHKNVQYYTTLQVGSNNQSMTVLVDTGSNLLWLPSSNIVGRANGNRFNYLLSTTFKNLNETRSIQVKHSF